MLGHRAICEYPLCYAPAISAIAVLYAPPSEVIVQHIVNNDLGILPTSSGSWKTHKALMPDGPNADNDVVAVYDSVGWADGRLISTGEPVWHHGVQVLVRARSYTTGWVQAQKIERLMWKTKRVAVTVRNRDYLLENVQQTSPIFPLGQERNTKRRELFSLNFLVTLRET